VSDAVPGPSFNEEGVPGDASALDDASAFDETGSFDETNSFGERSNPNDPDGQMNDQRMPTTDGQMATDISEEIVPPPADPQDG
jgi:hypothetical protein